MWGHDRVSQIRSGSCGHGKCRDGHKCEGQRWRQLEEEKGQGWEGENFSPRMLQPVKLSLASDGSALSRNALVNLRSCNHGSIYRQQCG